MTIWPKKTPPPLPRNHHKEFEDEDDLLYVLEKKVNAILVDKENEIAGLKHQIHDNTRFLQQIVLELIAKGAAPSTTMRSSSVPVGNSANANTKSVKELIADAKSNGPLAGPAGKLP